MIIARAGLTISLGKVPYAAWLCRCGTTQPPVSVAAAADTDRVAAQWRDHTTGCHAAAKPTSVLPPYTGWTEDRFPSRCATCGFPALTRDPRGRARHIECATRNAAAPARKDSTCMTRTDLKAAALACAKRGLRVFPIHPGGRIAVHSEWETLATTDPARIERFWDHNPTHNVGVACGPSGLVVVDLDMPKHPGDVPDPDKPKEAEWARLGVRNGRDVLAVLAQRANAPFPDGTFTVTTRSGGTHVYFAAPDGSAIRSTIGTHGWKVDTRANGGYVIAPGSQRGGKPYVVSRDIAVAPLPDWLVTLLTPKPVVRRTGPVKAPANAGRYAKAAFDNECANVRDAGEGTRATTLLHAARALGRFVASGELSRGEVETALREEGCGTGLPEREVVTTIRRALDYSIAPTAGRERHDHPCILPPEEPFVSRVPRAASRPLHRGW